MPNCFNKKFSVRVAVHDISISMHDGARRRKSKVVSEYLTKSKVEILDWPENSPNLDPIETLWRYTKNKVLEKQPFSAAKLLIAIKEISVNNRLRVLRIPSSKYAHPSCYSSARENRKQKILKSSLK